MKESSSRAFPREQTTPNRDRKRTKNSARGKERPRETKIYPKLDESWINDFFSDKKILREKPSAWRSPPKIGMDKIRARTNLAEYFVDFASSSTIHGLNHLTAPHRHPIERILAVIFIGGALACLILLSLNFWDRYQNDAIISILDNDYRSFTITKPAVLVCPVDRYDENKFRPVFEKHGIKDTEEAREFFAFLANATHRDWINTPIYDEVSPDQFLTILWDLKGDVVTDHPDQNSKSWIVTDQGLCLFFYTHIGVYSSYDYWMENNWTVLALPEELPEYNYEQREEVQTLNVLTHAVTMSAFHPVEIPDPDISRVLINQRHIIGIETIPKEIKTSPAVKSLSIHQRHCKIPLEGGLRMWPIYTQFMCIQECKFELMRQRCGCYPHFARPMPGIPNCTAKQLRCIGERRQEFIHVTITAGKRCRCLPNCDTASYEVRQISDAAMKEGSPKDAIMNFHVDFPPEIIRRELLFGFIDFLTSVGGAAGLFLGASVISFIEIIYYVTLRLIWYRVEMRKKRERRSKMKNNIARRKKINVVTKY